MDLEDNILREFEQKEEKPTNLELPRKKALPYLDQPAETGRTMLP